MDRDTLLHDLADTERDIALGVTQLAGQRVLIAELDLERHGRWEAIEALAVLREMQEAHERRRELILRALFAATLTFNAVRPRFLLGRPLPR
jgi:hypothetical protein